MVLFFSSPPDVYGYRQSLIFVLMLLPVLAGTAYLIIYYLVPRYLLKRRFFLFGLYTVYAIIGAAWLETMIVMGLLMIVYEYNVELLNPRIQDIGYLTGTIVLVILPAIAIHITQQWYREREANIRLHQEKLELELFARQKEINYLKEQIHPHFLFNALNSLYGLTLEKSDEAPELVLKVSDMLDYMLYQRPDSLVPLSDELNYINNYLDIQKMRCGDRLNLSLNIDAGSYGCRIAPLLLLPFVENCFKHGVSATSGQSFVSINLTFVDEQMHFHVVNSLPADRPEISNSGIGLANVRKRLELLYGDDSTLHCRQTEKEYQVELIIPLKKIIYEKMEMPGRG